MKQRRFFVRVKCTQRLRLHFFLCNVAMVDLVAKGVYGTRKRGKVESSQKCETAQEKRVDVCEASEYITDCTEIHTENHFSCDELPIDDSVEECKKKSMSSGCSFGHKQRWNMARIGLSYSEESSACACGTATRACVLVSNQPPKAHTVTTTTQLERKRETIFVDLQLRLYQRNAESKILPPRREFHALVVVMVVVVVKWRSSTRSCLTQRVVAAAKDRALAVACALCAAAAALRSVQESCAAGKSVISLIMQWTAVCTAKLSSLVRRCRVYDDGLKTHSSGPELPIPYMCSSTAPPKRETTGRGSPTRELLLVSVDSTSIIQRKKERRPRRLAFIHCIYPTPHDLFASPESHIYVRPVRVLMLELHESMGMYVCACTSEEVCASYLVTVAAATTAISVA
ncbi:unnamed protein product [Trichogramma brassicae]|uniref:Uncharacterized protein n=1 Tax=Trichogramma brassicae TaxID=86971 RepID=A0A6H5IQG5_9HYME|nr:unnamed protein product [Trichogramma brassicae]